jgi:integral membrane sensor domain MASE1
MHRGSLLRAKSLASVAMVALMFGVASIASAQRSSGIWAPAGTARSR